MKCCPECKNINVVQLTEGWWCRSCGWSSTGADFRTAPRPAQQK